MKKILFVINTLGRAGAEMAMIEMMKNFDQFNYEIYLFVLLSQGELIDRIPKHVKILNKKYDKTPINSRLGNKVLVKNVLISSVKNFSLIRNVKYIFSNGINMIRNKNFQKDKLLWKIVSDGSEKIGIKFDLAISYIEGGSAYYVADHVNAVKKVAFIHIDYVKAGYCRKLDNDCYNKFDRIFTVSSEVKDVFIKYYPEHRNKTMIFHNILDKDEIIKKSNMDGGFTDSYDGVRLLTVGRLTYQKGYDIAVKVMNILRNKGVDAKWYVLGEGPERKHIEELIEKYKLKNRFILLGDVANPYPYFKQCDIYVHASRFEGKSISIQEAQILGCAIAASDCSGNREQIENGVDGILLDYKIELMAEELELLIGDKKLRNNLSKAVLRKKILFKEDINMIYEMMD